ncbi:hypothetical protein V6N12_014924 [Hibiscus sabdariffa]|uniref:Uncharacterized protein n=1 Tax=Hibiscus sabdariffa TaxID=183260 RepID=A0ABR2DLM4_9ROSI
MKQVQGRDYGKLKRRVEKGSGKYLPVPRPPLEISTSTDNNRTTTPTIVGLELGLLLKHVQPEAMQFLGQNFICTFDLCSWLTPLGLGCEMGWLGVTIVRVYTWGVLHCPGCRLSLEGVIGLNFCLPWYAASASSDCHLLDSMVYPKPGDT